jgi:hypothetical protein
MSARRSFTTIAGIAVLLAACTHNGTQSSVMGGDVSIDSLTATRTAILRVQNNYPTEVRVYTVIGGQANYVAKAMPGETRTTVLDPNLFPSNNVSFEARPVDGTASHTVGPLKINKGETVELVVPATLENTRATVHRSTP